MQRAFIKPLKKKKGIKTQGNISVISPNKGMKPIAMNSLTVIRKCRCYLTYCYMWCGSAGANLPQSVL